jgi:hypothetical protein
LSGGFCVGGRLSRFDHANRMILNGINLIEEHDETCAISIPRCEDD